MGEGYCMKHITEALKSNDTKSAFFMWNQLKKGGIDVTKNPLYFLSAAKSFSNRGDMEGVIFNINKAIELLGK